MNIPSKIIQVLKGFPKLAFLPYNNSIITSFADIAAIYRGKGFSFRYRFDLPITAQTKTFIVVTPPSERYVVWREAEFLAKLGDVDIDFYSEPTYEGGTALKINNLNRFSSNTAQTQILEGATVSDNGEPLTPSYIGGGTGGPQSQGGSNITRRPWILKPGTTFAIVITANGSQDNKVFIDVALNEEEV